jgi:hypothetical protein
MLNLSRTTDNTDKNPDFVPSYPWLKLFLSKYLQQSDFHAKLRKLSYSKLKVIEIQSRRRHLASRNFSYQEP